MPGVSPPAMLSPSLKIPAGPLSGTRVRGGNTSMLCYGAQARLLAATTATKYACLALDLSVTNMPVSNVYKLPRNRHFVKLSHDDDTDLTIMSLRRYL